MQPSQDLTKGEVPAQINSYAESAKRCRACDGLLQGTSCTDRPHNFLALTSRCEETGVRVYECAICQLEMKAKFLGTRFDWF